MNQALADEDRVAVPPAAIRRAAWSLVAFVVATLIITALVWQEWALLYRVDDAIVTAAVSWTQAHPELHDPLNRIGVTSGKRMLWPLSAVVAAMLWLAGRRFEGFLIALTVFATTLATGGLKRVLTRDRPEWYVPEDPLPTTSFPSGHVSLWTGFVLALVIVLPLLFKGRLSAPAARMVAAPLVLLVLVVSLQRVLQGRHYPSDVLVGALVGAGCALASWLLLLLIIDRWRAWVLTRAGRSPTS